MPCFIEMHVRCSHVTPELWGRRPNNHLLHEKNSKSNTSKKGKSVKRARIEPPVDAPYMPPKLKKKRTHKSLPDKTIEIFEGMKIVELAKRTGESISTMQDILVNVGEKFESEFDPLSVDITELVAMVFVNIVHVGVGPTSWSDVELAKACGACKEMMSKWLAAWSSMALSPNHQPRGSWGVGNLLLKDPAPLSGGRRRTCGP